MMLSERELILSLSPVRIEEVLRSEAYIYGWIKKRFIVRRSLSI